MGRRGTNRASTLDELIPAYAQNKQEMDDYKKICDEQNKAIKQCMNEQELSEATVGGWTAKVTVQHREKMNEDALLAVLDKSVVRDESGNCVIPRDLGIIKSKDYVDMDALESAIYKGLIPTDVLMSMDSCRETTDICTLRVTKAKKNKED
nr:MAG TPA: hypothetical protein [Caudoviricetes sp.]